MTFIKWNTLQGQRQQQGRAQDIIKALKHGKLLKGVGKGLKVDEQI